MAVEFGLLGEVTANVDGRTVNLGPARQRCVLAALAVDVGRTVPAERLVKRVWGPDAPWRARETLYSYISRLRRSLAETGAVDIVLRSGGYALMVDQADPAVDLDRFRELCAHGQGDIALLSNALALWRGEPLTGLTGQWADAERARLRQERLTAQHALVDARLRAGQGGELVAELSARAVEHPLDEQVAAQYLLALYRSGRPADALEHYQRMRERLVEELGTDPGTALQDLHRRILDADPDLTSTTDLAADAPSATATPAAPRQLPAAPRSFTGQVEEFAVLTNALDSATIGKGATVVISALAGAGGIGKTWLALHWAHQHVDRFPDGQLFVDLQGFSPTDEPMDPAVAVRGFLDALGVDPDRIPPDLDAQATLYRSLVADRRMLVVLDNAATAEQVVPLLPGTPTCTVLVTGRHRLASLIDRHGARHLHLDVLSGDEARALLTARLGTDPVAADPDAVDELVELCGGHPLALSITARTAATRPSVPLAEVSAELRELGLEMLDHDTDPAASLPTVLSWSLRRLTEQQRTLFALLGITPGPDTTPPATAALASLSLSAARRALAALEEASLLERRPGGRYVMHDLIRAYATTIAHARPEPVRLAALERAVDYYLHTAHAADHLLEPHRDPIRLDPPAPGAHVHRLPDIATALAWFETHHLHLLASQHTAVARHRHQTVWHLAWVLGTFHRRRGHHHDELAVWQAALDSASRLSDPRTRTFAHRRLGYAYAELDQHESAVGHLSQALDLAEQHQDSAEQAYIHNSLATAWGRRGDDRRAFEHARHALDQYRALEQPVLEADGLNTVGWYAARLGDYDHARELCEAALALQRRHHDADGEAHSLDSLGFIDHRTGHHHRAVAHYRRALALFRSLGQTTYVSEVLDQLGHCHAALGQDEQAKAVWQEALKLYRGQGRDDDADCVRQQLDKLGGG
ncbi:BTAD domain-containing putative transcriptional regulator [Actinosynnema sp. NPDC050436]|uniref:AfsR/SARP family transcriptional regulator n=1 Tax=Actinosynnema sp. NPDC050436 TaxID=3155659 RepID=UPI0033E7D377